MRDQKSPARAKAYSKKDETFGGGMAVMGVERTIEADKQKLLIPQGKMDTRGTNLSLVMRECVGLFPQSRRKRAASCI